MNQKAIRGSLLLLLGSVIWGAAFAAQRMGMDHVGPFTFSGMAENRFRIIRNCTGFEMEIQRGKHMLPHPYGAGVETGRKIW